MKTEILSGFHSVGEALAADRRRFSEMLIAEKRSGRRFSQLRDEAERRDIPIVDISFDRLSGLTESNHHQGIAARVSAYPYCGVEEILSTRGEDVPAVFLLILDSIVDPHNLGAMVRTALCAGVNGVVIPKDRSAAATPVVSRISAGALEHILIARVTNLARTLQMLKTQGLWIVGLAGQARAAVYELDLMAPLAMVIGGEEKGLRPLLKKQCDFLGAIPMAGPLDSLNASAAAAVALYEVRRQRSVGS